MASLNDFVLLILLTIALILVAEAAHERRAIPSEDEKKEFERQLKAINKPAIKSFRTEHGAVFDCIDINKQLAFDHHIIKNHSVQLKPTTVPDWIRGNNISHKVGPLQLLQQGMNCPDGTVIVKRITMQDLINSQRLKSSGFVGPKDFITARNSTDSNGKSYFAVVDYGPSSFSGVKGVFNLWDPQVSQDQLSLAYMAVGGGAGRKFASISVGWMVNPSLYQDNNAHLYASWIAHGGQIGCYDIRCPGFVQVSKMIPLGALLQPVSVYNGKQCELQLSLYQDRAKGDWWFTYGNENIGYWPSSLLVASNIANRANYGSWGGQAYSPVTEKTPSMGSGHWPRERLNKAAYVNSIKIINGKGKVVDPESDIMKTRSTNPKCYRVIYVHEEQEPWLNAVYFGGPAGCIGK